MDPERICMRDLVEPLCIGAASVDLNGQPECGNQDGLVFFEVVGMNMTLHISGNSVFRPAPFPHRFRKKLESTARCRKSTLDLPVNINPYKPATCVIAVRRR